MELRPTLRRPRGRRDDIALMRERRDNRLFLFDDGARFFFLFFLHSRLLFLPSYHHALTLRGRCDRALPPALRAIAKRDLSGPLWDACAELGEAGGDDDDANLAFLQLLVLHHAEDNLRILVDGLIDDFRGFLHFHDAEIVIACDDKENTLGAADRDIKELRIDRLFAAIAALIVALADADAHERRTGVSIIALMSLEVEY